MDADVRRSVTGGLEDAPYAVVGLEGDALDGIVGGLDPARHAGALLLAALGVGVQGSLGTPLWRATSILRRNTASGSSA
jgi:hypothetical protein